MGQLPSVSTRQTDRHSWPARQAAFQEITARPRREAVLVVCLGSWYSFMFYRKASRCK